MKAELSLAGAAMRLGMTYHQVRALLLRGDLEGGQDENGRFFVDADAVDRWLSQGQPPAARAH